jgi:hypothetical protein
MDFLELPYIPDFSEKSGICLSCFKSLQSPGFSRLQYSFNQVGVNRRLLEHVRHQHYQERALQEGWEIGDEWME